MAPRDKPRLIRVRPDSMPRTFGESAGLHPDPEMLRRFKPRSMFAEYKVLTAVFLLAALVLGFFFVKWVRTAPPAPPLQPAQQSVYVDMLPAGDASPKQPAGEPAQEAPKNSH
jgi:hypothetical protein